MHVPEPPPLVVRLNHPLTPFLIVGLDLAGAERNGDGLCLLAATDVGAQVLETAHVFGDAALLDWLNTRLPPAPAPAMLLFDAPLLCPNVTGSRPVDRLTHTLFGRFHAGAHPANAARCPRPLRLAALVERELGFTVGWRQPRAARLAVETFPHPATVRWLMLDRIIKYKRGPIAARRGEFARLQTLLCACLSARFPDLSVTPVLHEALSARWTKPAEDRLDAFICALIGYQHWRDDGTRSEVIGDGHTGFILLPAAEKSEAKVQNAKLGV